MLMHCYFCNATLTKEATIDNPRRDFECACSSCGEYHITPGLVLKLIWEANPVKKALIARTLRAKTEQPVILTIEIYHRLLEQARRLSLQGDTAIANDK